VEAELAIARAKTSDDQALIAHQQLQIKKLTRELYGSRSERTSRLLDQIELQFEELESAATEDEIVAEKAVAKTTAVTAFTRKRPERKPFPEHLPRERVIVPGPTICLCCGGSRLRKPGETITEWRLKMHGLPHISAHPARVGRHVSRGFLQSIPSSMYASCAAEIDTAPPDADGQTNFPWSSRLA
jgi:hypothetical protein